MRLWVQIILLCLVFQTVVFAKKYKFAPIPAADWLVELDSTNTQGAVVLKHVLKANDRDLLDGRIIYQTFKRIRVASEAGRDYAKVTLPFVHRKSKIEEIQARCVLPDGQTILLDKSQIEEQEFVKTKGLRIKQKTFTVPGVTTDCIIEYYYRIRTPERIKIWKFQTDIPLVYGELSWEFYRGKGVPFGWGKLLSGVLTPNYTWENFKNVEVAMLPEDKDDKKEALFRVRNVPALADEPFSPPDVSIQGIIHFYYSGEDKLSAFWLRVSGDIEESYNEFTKKDKEAKALVEKWRMLPDNAARMRAAHDWLQNNIVNVDYFEDEEKDFKENKHMKDMLKREYGSSVDINFSYLYFLRKMGISANLVYTHDREDNPFFKSVKRWQFDRSFVVTPKGINDYYYHSPAQKNVPYREIPWYYQGSVAYLINETGYKFMNVPMLDSKKNKFSRFLWLAMDDEFQLEGEMLERFEGQYGYRERLYLDDLSEVEIEEYFKEDFLERFPIGNMDSLALESLEEGEKRLDVKCNVNLEAEIQEVGNRILIKPVEIMGAYENPFISADRQNDIVFQFAGDEIESVTLNLPEGWIVDALPEATAVTNRIGTYNLVFQSLNAGTKIAIQRVFKLKHPWLTNNAYRQVAKLFAARQAQEDLTVVLKPAE
ncbi:MAG: DUF3857 domain-containing protein [Calditrichia bacterium]